MMTPRTLIERILLILCVLFLTCTSFAQQQPSPTLPRMLRFTGAVTNSDGSARAGVVGIMFSVYKDQQGGAALWTEIQNVKLDANGNYSVLLGSEHPDGVPAELFTTNEARWLGVQVEADPEQPRVMLVSVPYALKAGDAETLGGRPLTDFVLTPEASGATGGTGSTATTSSTAPATSSLRTSSVSASSTGTQNFVAKWMDNAGTLGNSAITEVSGFVGINTTSPGERLDISGGTGSNYLRVLTGSNNPGTKAGFYAANTFGSPIWRIQGDASSGNFDLSTGPSFAPRLAIDATSGYVGFGTTSPQERIDIAGGNSSSYLRIAPGSNAPGTKAGMYAVNAAGSPLWRLQGDTSSGSFDLGVGPSFNSRLAINYANGNVGFGTTAPQERVDIAGGTASNYLRIAAGANDPGTKVGFYAVNASGSPMWRLQGDTSSGALDIGVGPNFEPRISIDYSSGNVGIGVTPGQKLSVAGMVESTSGGFKFPDGSVLSSAVNISGSSNYYGSTSDQILHVTQNGPGAGSLSVSTLPSALRGDASAQSGYVSGLLGVSSSPSGFGVTGENLSNSGYAIGTFGVSTLSPTGTGVWGEAEATSGDAVGVYGKSFSVTGTGVLGYANAGTGDAVGVYGRSDSTGGTGVWGDSTANSGATFGVYGTVASSSGSAGVFDNTASGNILVGRIGTTTRTNVFRVDGAGRGYFNGGTQTSGADFAESVEVAGPVMAYEPGDVLMIDAGATRRLALANEAYSTRVAGIYSTKPGILATPHMMDDPRLTASEVPLAVVGIVPCKVTTENGPIEPGDLLVVSSKAGYAMKGTDRGKMLGAVVGKAMQALKTGTGTIEVLVSLH